jgi:hypothetical protein
MATFQPFPKLARLSRECVVTEKLDGTNACVVISEYVGDFQTYLNVEAQSRTRMIYPGKKTDNFGFAEWVREHEEELKKLGPGYHYGEWYGKGIQRGYGLNERRFALFNTSRYVAGPEPATQEFDGRIRVPSCCEVVPELYRGNFFTTQADIELHNLASTGSRAVPGFMNPEGIVVYHTHAGVAFKKTFDDRHKEAA